MRTTLNRKAIEEGRRCPVVKALPKADDLRWEAYLQVHRLAEDLGILGSDDGLHTLLNDRLAEYEELFED